MKIDKSDIIDIINNIGDKIDDILYKLIIGCLAILCYGTAAAVGGLSVFVIVCCITSAPKIIRSENLEREKMMQEFLNSTFELKEHSILAKSSEQYISGSRRYRVSTNYDYEFIIDADEDGVYNKNKDFIIHGDNIPFFLAEKNNKVVYIERKEKSFIQRDIIAIKDKNDRYNVTSSLSDIYGRCFEKNESFNKMDQLFNEKILNQR